MTTLLMNTLSPDDINELFSDPVQFQEMFIDIVDSVGTPLTTKICNKLREKQIDSELDQLLRVLGMTQPYSFLVPTLREHLGITIHTEENCIAQLKRLSPTLSESNQNIIKQIIEFMERDDGVYELDETMKDPVELLLSLIPKMNMENRTIGLNCLEYLAETISLPDESS